MQIPEEAQNQPPAPAQHLAEASSMAVAKGLCAE